MLLNIDLLEHFLRHGMLNKQDLRHLEKERLLLSLQANSHIM